MSWWCLCEEWYEYNWWSVFAFYVIFYENVHTNIYLGWVLLVDRDNEQIIFFSFYKLSLMLESRCDEGRDHFYSKSLKDSPVNMFVQQWSLNSAMIFLISQFSSNYGI